MRSGPAADTGGGGGATSKHQGRLVLSCLFSFSSSQPGFDLFFFSCLRTWTRRNSIAVAYLHPSPSPAPSRLPYLSDFHAAAVVAEPARRAVADPRRVLYHPSTAGFLLSCQSPRGERGGARRTSGIWRMRQAADADAPCCRCRAAARLVVGGASVRSAAAVLS